jgi:opine dehydrogenase
VINPSKTTRWTVVGGGNGGQAAAGHLAHMGFSVCLFDIFSETVDVISSQGGIQLQGAVEGFGRLALATTDLHRALQAAEVVMIVAPATAHRTIAKNCAPFLRPDQIVFVHPGATGGALEVKHVLQAEGAPADVTVAESNSLLYACRSPRPGQVSIFGIKQELTVAAIPSVQTAPTVDLLRRAFPQMTAGINVMETSLSNPNAMMHPAPTLLNTSLIESDRDWLYYWNGITPAIGAFVEAMDQERVALARAFGLNLPTIRQWYRLAYGAEGATLSETVQNNPAYAQVKGQKSLRTRYLLEDIPMGLVPMVSLGGMLGVGVERMEAVVKLVEFLIQEDLTGPGRTVESLGLAGMSAGSIQHYLDTGRRE